SKIVIPVSGKKHCARAMKALDLVHDICVGEIILLHVIEPIPLAVSRRSYEEIFQEEADEARARMTPIISRLTELGLSHRIRFTEGDLADSIVRIAEEEGVDLIAMYTDAQSALSRFLGPVAERVLRLTAIPVLAARG
ncbi:MAG: universal stress protein, partial [Desulfovibrionaceae bacterium]|nr:universal stress protein [Desulfovibrionaceae bacterium]